MSDTGITLPAEPFEWDDQKGLLFQAALEGSVEFLEECVSRNAPNDYYLSQWDDTEENFLHVALGSKKISFISKVFELLDPEVIHQLLLQQSNFLYNPLHLAVFYYNIEAIVLILEFCSSRPNLKPWLQTDIHLQTPCHVAMTHNKEDVALAMLDMDVEGLSLMVDAKGRGLLYMAIERELYKAALKILELSPPSFSCSGPRYYSPLHILPEHSEREDIMGLLLEKASDVVEKLSDEGRSILHEWPRYGKVWPYKYLLEKGTAIIPGLKRRLVDLMSSTTQPEEMNPFHFMAGLAPREEVAVEIMKMLMQVYREEVPQSEEPPWLARCADGCTPLIYCLQYKHQKLAMHILLEEKDALMQQDDQGIALVYAVEMGCSEVAMHILNTVDTEQWTELKGYGQKNALHYAPYCTKEFLELLINGNRKLMEGLDESGSTVLHSWAEVGYEWPFEYILKKDGINNSEWDNKLLSLFGKVDKEGNTIFHYALRNKQETANDMVKLLIKAYKELNPVWDFLGKDKLNLLPWFEYNNAGDGPLHEAIKNNREELAVIIWSQLEGSTDTRALLDYYKPPCRTLFLAMENHCYRVAKKLVSNLGKQDRTPYLKVDNEKNILHLAPTCTEKEFGKWLVAEVPEFILEEGNNGKTPLEEASDEGADWIIRAMLQTDPTSMFDNAPYAWTWACEKGHISAVRAFVECYPGRFKDHCVKHEDSPLHYITLPDITSYEEFFSIPHMKTLVNFQDSYGATPLHIAIQNENIHLTEVLLSNKDVLLDINDNNNQTARYLLGKICKEDEDWLSLSTTVRELKFINCFRKKCAMIMDLILV